MPELRQTWLEKNINELFVVTSGGDRQQRPAAATAAAAVLTGADSRPIQRVSNRAPNRWPEVSSYTTNKLRTAAAADTAAAASDTSRQQLSTNKSK